MDYKSTLIPFCLVMLGLLHNFVVECSEREMTIVVEPGKRECFFLPTKLGKVVDIEYQVINGGHGDLDIGFDLAEPLGKILFADVKRSENIHRHEAHVDGDYRFCFDNTFSTFNSKTVFFIIDDNEASDPDDVIGNYGLEGLTPNEFIDMKMEDFNESVEKLSINLSKVRVFQELQRTKEARDRNVAEENYYRVNVWSMFQIMVMLAVGGIQVIMVRSLFDANSKVHKVWTKFS